MKSKNYLLLVFMLIRVYLWDTFIIGFGGVVILLLSFILLPLAIPFRYDDTNTWLSQGKQPLFKGWKYIRLPKWARIFEGEVGCMGDGTQEYVREAKQREDAGMPVPWNKIADRANSFKEIFQWFRRNSGGGWDRIIKFDMDPNTKVTYWGTQHVGDDSGESGWNITYANNGKRSSCSFYLIIDLGLANSTFLTEGYTINLFNLYKFKIGGSFNKGDPICFRHRTGYKVKPAYYQSVTRWVDSTFLSTSIKYFGRR